MKLLSLTKTILDSFVACQTHLRFIRFFSFLFFSFFFIFSPPHLSVIYIYSLALHLKIYPHFSSLEHSRSSVSFFLSLTHKYRRRMTKARGQPFKSVFTHTCPPPTTAYLHSSPPYVCQLDNIT